MRHATLNSDERDDRHRCPHLEQRDLRTRLRVWQESRPTLEANTSPICMTIRWEVDIRHPLHVVSEARSARAGPSFKSVSFALGRNPRHIASHHVRRRGKVGRRENEVLGATAKLERQKPSALVMMKKMLRVDRGWARTFGMEIKSLRTSFLPSSSTAHLVEIVKHELEFC